MQNNEPTLIRGQSQFCIRTWSIQFNNCKVGLYIIVYLNEIGCLLKRLQKEKPSHYCFSNSTSFPLQKYLQLQIKYNWLGLL